MRTEMKIGLGLYAASTVSVYLFSTPEIIYGMTLSLSIFFLVIGLLSESKYAWVKGVQRQKLNWLKGLIKLN